MKIQELKMASFDYTIKELCAVFELNQSTYYDQVKENPLTEEKKKIISIIKQTAIETKHTYGKRRMQQQLELEGISIGIHKPSSLMKKANVVAIKPKKKHYYPNGDLCDIKIENVLDSQFKQLHIGLETLHIFVLTKAGAIYPACLI